jgi:hypothetical protein
VAERHGELHHQLKALSLRAQPTAFCRPIHRLRRTVPTVTCDTRRIRVAAAPQTKGDA